SLLFFCISVRAQLTKSVYNYSGTNIRYWQFKPRGYDQNSAHKFPLIISLGGVGERGDTDDEMNTIAANGILLQVTNGATMQFTYNGQQESFLILSPQLSKSYGNWQEFYIDAMIEYAKANLNVDPNRIFLTGYSLGGGGTWKYATSSAARAANLAGIIPAAGSPDYYTNGFCYIAQNKVATWAFHAADDGTVDPNYTRFAVSSINACSGLQVPARARIYPDGNHAIWNVRTYDTSNTWQYPNIYQWMMKVSRSINPATDVPPVANAGPTVINLTVPARNTNIVLNGYPSSDADDIVSEYLWTKASNNPLYYFTNFYGTAQTSEWPAPTVVSSSNGSGGWLDLGDYTFTLQVKDYKSQISTTTITYHVQKPATGNALPGAYVDGNTVTLSSTQTSTSFSGEGKDWDGTLSAYKWTQLTGPATVTMNGADGNFVTMSNVVTPGTYTFRFRVTDNQGGTGDATATIIKQSASSLPVTYGYFRGESAGSSNVLSWATVQESNSDHFNVQRSTDGVLFTPIGAVTATGATNGSSYTFTDVNAPQGKALYRLQQVDKDGKSTISDIITINNAGRGYVMTAWPNPAKDNLWVTISGNLYGKLQVLVTDMQGRVVSQELISKSQSSFRKDIHISQLQSGL
ncbi:MAG: dienelactone hydrolase family protein, partial [Bacteroidetes bacterium]|nr:dienelactone hydrolase family protein [Bacteroidota bacterium]